MQARLGVLKMRDRVGRGQQEGGGVSQGFAGGSK